MTEREEFDFNEMKQAVLEEQGYRCAICHREAPAPQWAHIIPQSTYNLKKYGRALIHHRLNGVVVCSLGCNQVVSLRNAPIQEAALCVTIRKAIEEEGA